MNTHLPFLISRTLFLDWLVERNWLMSNLDILQRMEQGKEKPEGYGMQIDLSTPDGEIIASLNEKSETATQGRKSKSKLFATISYIGPIYKYGWGGSKDFGNALKLMASDDAISAVRIILDSPGGEAAGTRELYQIIRDFPKPILVVTDGLMASAAYYLGAGADQIVATQPNDRIGSIGTMVSIPDIVGWFSKMGLNIYEIYSPDSTEKNKPFRDLIASKGGDSKAIEKELKFTNDIFLADVKAVRPAVTDDTLKGAVYYAPEAKERGLIDDIVSMEDTLQILSTLPKKNQKTTITMNFLQKVRAALLEEEQKQDTTPTPTTDDLQAELAATQQELQEAKENLQTTKQKLSETEQSLASANTKITTLEAELSTAQSERDEWKVKAEEYGQQPGEIPTQAQQSKTDDVDETSEMSLRDIIDGLPSERAAAQAGY